MTPDPIVPPAPGAPLLQAVVTLGLALLLTFLHRRHGKAHFRWWAAALYARVLSVGAIVAFMFTAWEPLLFLHQVFIGWTALGFLYAAEVFSRQLVWRPRYWLLVAFPIVWSAVAIFGLDEFALAAGPAVLFLAIATARAGIVFRRYRRRTGSAAAGFLEGVLLLWSLHHLDYPVLRARGAWDPWGYYLDILFVLAMGAGILLLVIEEQREGLRTLTALSDSVRTDASEGSRHGLLARPLQLRGVRGTALLRVSDTALVAEGAAGEAEPWLAGKVPPSVQRLAREAATSGRPQLAGVPAPSDATPPFTAALPLGRPSGTPMVLAIVGDLAAPFAALDDSILTAVGEQVGLALERAELMARLATRSAELERLSVRLLQEQEAQRRRIGRELHDETAQIFSALKLHLGSLREESSSEARERFDRLLEWVDRGSASIRAATEGLRPAVLDDLGLLPALRSLVADFREWSGLAVTFDAAPTLPTARSGMSPAADLALFRALQEALSNVLRHAQAHGVVITLGETPGGLRLIVADDGIAREAMTVTTFLGPGRSGLVGMRERLAAVGGTLRLSTDGTGLTLTVDVPMGTA